MKKNWLKIILDVIIAILLILMYNKVSISISFHEIGGLVVFGFFLIHKALSWNWIVQISRKIFNRSLPARTRFGFILNLILFLSMIFIALSGIMISKTILTGISGLSRKWKFGHYFISAVALAATGIHVGLHWSFIKAMLGRVIKLPQVIAKPLSILCLAVILLFGAYNLVASDFSGWLSIPFQMSRLSDNRIPAAELERLEEEISSTRPHEHKGMGSPERTGSNSPVFGQIFTVIATYGSISGLFAFLTVVFEKLFRLKKRNAN